MESKDTGQYAHTHKVPTCECRACIHSEGYKAGYEEGLGERAGGIIQYQFGYKAGRKEERDTWLRKTDIEKARDNFTGDIILRTRSQAFREVVEWGNEECYEHPYTSHLKGEEYNRKRHRCPECWQAQLKVWGITKERDEQDENRLG